MQTQPPPGFQARPPAASQAPAPVAASAPASGSIPQSMVPSAYGYPYGMQPQYRPYASASQQQQQQQQHMAPAANPSQTSATGPIAAVPAPTAAAVPREPRQPRQDYQYRDHREGGSGHRGGRAWQGGNQGHDQNGHHGRGAWQGGSQGHDQNGHRGGRGAWQGGNQGHDQNGHHGRGAWQGGGQGHDQNGYVSQQRQGSNYGRRPQDFHSARGPEVPKEDFDFEASNALIETEKEASHTEPHEDFYDKSNSFFDNISCDAKTKAAGAAEGAYVSPPPLSPLSPFSPFPIGFSPNSEGRPRREDGRNNYETFGQVRVNRGGRGGFRGGRGGGYNRGGYDRNSQQNPNWRQQESQQNGS